MYRPRRASRNRALAAKTSDAKKSSSPLPFVQNPHKWHFSFGTFKNYYYLCTANSRIGCLHDTMAEGADILIGVY